MSEINRNIDDRNLDDRNLDERTRENRSDSGRSMDDSLQPTIAARAAGSGPTSREAVLEREKAEFGGMKFGSAFFGWLTATGTAVILTAVLAATGTAIGLGSNANTGRAADAASRNAGTIGLVGGIVLALILLVAYYCGGYVAGRMARFDGFKQGVAVWLWAIIAAIVLAIAGLIAGSQFNILANLNSFPRIPVNEGNLTVASIITAVIALIVTFLGAILGGLAGMRYHRRIDRVGLGR